MPGEGDDSGGIRGFHELEEVSSDDNSVPRRPYRYGCVSDSSCEQPSKRLRARRKRDRIDRISRLPESVIVHILSFLPILDSIRTGILSRRWQFLWTCVPTLRFNFHDIRGDYDDGEDDDDEDDDEKEDRDALLDFVELIDKTLVLCGGSVKDLGVNFGYVNRFASNVNLWTRFALRNDVQKFELDFHDSEGYVDDIYDLPQSLYTNSTFRELRFTYCKVEPKTTVAWNSLKKLSIGYVNLNDDAIRRILGGTPSLEMLELYYFKGLRSLHMGNSSVKKLILRVRAWCDGLELEISAPNVQSLEISGFYLNCHLVDVKSLVEATIRDLYLRYSTDDELVDKARGLLDSLAHAKTLKLGTWAIKGLAMLHTKRSSPRLLKCEYLTLDTELWELHPLGIAILLRYYPLLQSLIVAMSRDRVHFGHYYDSPSLLSRVEEDFSATPVPFSGGYTLLRKAKFVGFWKYSEPVFQFVQILLKNARMLQKMIIHVHAEDCYRHPPSADELFKIAQKLLSFQRASPNAELLVYK